MTKKRKMTMDMKMPMMGSKNMCTMCGASGSSCHCGSWVIVWGLLLVLLGVLLWLGRLTLDTTAAVVLILWGMKKFFMGCWMCKK